MKARQSVAGLFLVAIALYTGGCGRSPSRQAFDKARWSDGRKNNPELNACPAMLDDLMTNYLSLGMTLADVTNLLGSAEIRTPIGTSGVHIHGEAIEQVVYVYQPGMHNGWLVAGTNPLVLLFVHRSEYLREWSPLSVAVRPVSATDSEAARAAAPTGTLLLGHLPIAATPSQFDALLGPPDEKCTECQLDYFLGKRSRFAWDEVFLELHFDKSNRLSRMTWSEH
jgi:hypothetical protein